MDYKGYQKIRLDEVGLANFYSNDYNLLNTHQFKENEYIIITNLEDKPIDYYQYRNGKLNKILYRTITNKFEGEIKSRNIEQQLAINMLQDNIAKVKLIRGVYGSGKDYLMLNQALSYIEEGKFEKIIFIRPNVSVKDVPEIGYLKGTVYEKLSWTLGPFYDKVGGEEGVQSLINSNKLELVPLSFIRGRSFENAIVYVCEAQNITTEIAKLILGRVGENSELWLNADNHQTDNKIYEKDNGIIKMIEKLSGNFLFSYVYLSKSERSIVADLCELLDGD